MQDSVKKSFESESFVVLIKILIIQNAHSRSQLPPSTPTTTTFIDKQKIPLSEGIFVCGGASVT